MDLVAPHPSFSHRMTQVSHRQALGEDVGDDRSPLEKVTGELALVWIVSADSGDERAWADMPSRKHRRP